MTLAAAARSAAIGSMLALGACAAEREAGRDIAWESERVAPAGTAQQDAASAAPPGLDADGCREYTQTVRIGGEEQQAYGRACLQPDGSWRIHAPGAPAGAQGSGPATTQAVPAYRYVYPPYYYAPPAFFGSSFFFSHRHHHRHHHHRHHRGHRHFHHRR